MSKKETDIIPPTNLEMEFCELVGDLSQAVYECSYNDDDVLNGCLTGSIIEYSKFSSSWMLEEMGPKLEQLKDLVIELIQLTGGWPIEWYEPVTPFSKLPKKYIDIFVKSNRMDLLGFIPPIYAKTEYDFDFSSTDLLNTSPCKILNLAITIIPEGY